jgi:hypothetical protein
MISMISTKHSYPAGTKVYCWQFSLPQNGWIGGLAHEFWSDQRSKIAALAEHCDHPHRIIEGVSNGTKQFQNCR